MNTLLTDIEEMANKLNSQKRPDTWLIIEPKSGIPRTLRWMKDNGYTIYHSDLKTTINSEDDFNNFN